MYAYFPINPELTRPVAFEQREPNRPATHLEVIQRNREIDRQYWLDNMERADQTPARDHRTPTWFDGIRRTISRALINAGERIDPQAA